MSAFPHRGRTTYTRPHVGGHVAVLGVLPITGAPAHE